jgi:tetratricopeptide (TPR) repeat protein
MASTAGDSVFRDALACEGQGKVAEAKRLYERLIAEQPDHAPARVNLGTILYTRRDFMGARLQYEAAARRSPRYALAHYDLANTLEELGDNEGAVEGYKTAARLGYADAHYNLARLFEKIREPRKAMLHWLAYTKVDSSGQWYDIAKQSFKALLAADRLKIVRSNTSPRRTKRRAGLAAAS